MLKAKALRPMGCVTLGKPLRYSEPQLPFPWKGHYNTHIFQGWE